MSISSLVQACSKYIENGVARNVDYWQITPATMSIADACTRLSDTLRSQEDFTFSIGVVGPAHHRQYQSRSESRADSFDYIERFHNPKRKRKLAALKQEQFTLTQQSV